MSVLQTRYHVYFQYDDMLKLRDVCSFTYPESLNPLILTTV
jgi:hypothetical protein